MTNLILASLATAFLLSAVEGLVKPLGKWRGLVALALSASAIIILEPNGRLGTQAVTCLAASFLSMTFSMLAVTLVDMSDTRVVKGMPRRIPPL